MVIQFQIGVEIALFYKFEHFKYIALIKTLLWCVMKILMLQF